MNVRAKSFDSRTFIYLHPTQIPNYNLVMRLSCMRGFGAQGDRETFTARPPTVARVI